MSQRPPPKPWSMKWIVLAILVCIIPYTWVTVKYRKEGKAHEPYFDNKQKAQELRLEQSGVAVVPAELSRPVEPELTRPPAPHANVRLQSGGLPAFLQQALIDRPLLPSAVTAVVAPAHVGPTEPYVIQFSSAQLSDHEQPATATAYRRGNEVYLVVALDSLPGQLASRARDTIAQLRLADLNLSPGSYQFTLVAAESSQQWTVTVR